jgi:hypothetical protein
MSIILIAGLVKERTLLLASIARDEPAGFFDGGRESLFSSA